MSILAIGLNHRTTPVDLREQLYLRPDALRPVLLDMGRQHGIDELAILSTCNRLEIYAATSEPATTEQDILHFIGRHYGKQAADLSPYFYVYQGQSAVRHLMRVASGLDSLVLGETQILGQVGAALEAGAGAGTIRTLLHRLFEAAQHAGKRARTETAISQHTTSVSHAAALLIRNQSETPPNVLVIGAGEMAQLALQALSDFGLHNITITNRTLEHAQRLATDYGCTVATWSTLWDELAKADAVITATGAPHPLLYENDMRAVVRKREGRRLLLVDIAVPRDVDTGVHHVDNIDVHDIDRLQHIIDESLNAREQQIPAVEAIIEIEVEQYWSWFNERSIVPVIRDLRAELQTVVQLELEAALNKLPDLDPQGQEIVRRMAHRIVNKVLHTPTLALRAHAAQGDGEMIARAVRDLFALQPSDDVSEDRRLYA